MAKVEKCKVAVSDTGLTFAFKDVAETVVVVNVDDFDEEIKRKAMFHGFEQKLRDSYAGAESPDEAAGLFQKVLDNLYVRKWVGRTAGEGGSEAPTKLLAQALVNVRGGQITLEQATAALTATTPEKRRAIRSIPEIAVELAKLRSKAKEGVSIESILGL